MAGFPRSALLLTFGAAAAGLALLAAHLEFDLGGARFDDFANDWLYNAVMLVAAGLVLARGILVRRERAAWLVLGVGVLAWSAGDIYYTLVLADDKFLPFPSASDAMYLAFYPACYLAIILLLRSRLRWLSSTLGFDALIAASAIAAVGVAFLGAAVFTEIPGGALPNAVNLAYPVGDLVLLAFLVAVLALTGWRPGKTWALLGGALALSALGDVIYLGLAAQGTYTEGTILDAVWPASLLLLAVAAWQRPERLEVQAEGMRVLAFPSLFALISFGLLTYSQFDASIVKGALGLARLSLLFVIIRMALTLRENVRMLAQSREEALTDSLTGLGNRRCLMQELEREVEEATASAPRLLLLYDLDGFKHYNDSFGHMAGDSLLARMGRRLADSVRPNGEAYRLGGDEFCVLARVNGTTEDEIAVIGSDALSDRGEGFVVGNSYGSVLMPGEASDAREALMIADRRMYAGKERRPGSPRRQTANVLRQILAERDPELVSHSCEVAELAVTVGQQLAMRGQELDELAHAAELHDIGKVAIPKELLNKPAALDEAETLYMRRHPVIGERVLDAAPAMRNVAKLVRASHEHYNGSGYPDGLAGDEIPLGARIVAVCDAFDAMTTDRPYRVRMSSEDALAELRRCRGGQFDPVVVDVFCREIETRGEDSRYEPAPKSVEA